MADEKPITGEQLRAIQKKHGSESTQYARAYGQREFDLRRQMDNDRAKQNLPPLDWYQITNRGSGHER